MLNSIPSYDKKIGQILLEQKLIEFTQLAAALEVQATRKISSEKHLKLGEILIFTKQLTTEQLQSALRQQFQKAKASRAESIRSFNRNDSTQSKKSPSHSSKDDEPSFVKRLFGIFKK